jgi:hypothetical protein
VSTLPFASTAAQKDALEHDTPLMLPPGSIEVGADHPLLAPAGLGPTASMTAVRIPLARIKAITLCNALRIRIGAETRPTAWLFDRRTLETSATS